ncbi:MAG: flagellar basal body P-ring formation chaperone FlgA [Planctomycetota bacterium]
MNRMNRFEAWILLVTALCGFLAESAAAETASIHLKDSARVCGRVVLLREVASIDDAGAALIEQLGGIELGLSPNPGFSRYIPRETIESRIRAHGYSDKDLKIRGAEGVTVQVKSVQLSGEELFHLGREFLESELSSLDGEYTIEIVRNAAGVLIPVGNGLTTFKVRWHNAPRTLGIVTLDIQVLVDSELFTTVSLQYKILRFDYVLIATEEINRNEPFTTKNTTVARTEITQVKGNIARSVKEMALYLAKQRVEPGNVIQIEDGFLPDIVLRGQPVRVTVQKGALSIRSHGTARQNGAFGDTIEILNPDSGNTFKCTVTGHGQVTVKL